MDVMDLVVVIGTADFVPVASCPIRISRGLYEKLVEDNEGPHIIHNFLTDILQKNNRMEDNQEILSIDEMK
jgi:hypothetical protein